MVGVSIGAINSAIIAGNPPEERLQKLDASGWTSPPGSVHRLAGGRPPRQTPQRRFRPSMPCSSASRASSSRACTMRWLAPRGSHAATALYDSSPSAQTLGKLVDFDLINNGEVRFAVGAVNVALGQFRPISTTRIWRSRPSISWPAAPCPRLCPWSESATIFIGMADWSPTRRCSTCSPTSTPATMLGLSGRSLRGRRQHTARHARTSCPARKKSNIRAAPASSPITSCKAIELKQDLRDALNMIPNELLPEDHACQGRTRARLSEINSPVDLPTKGL